MSGTAGKHVMWNLRGEVYHSLRRSKTSNAVLRVRHHPVATVAIRAQCGAVVGNQWQKPVEASEREASKWGLRSCRRCFGADYTPRWHEHGGAV